MDKDTSPKMEMNEDVRNLVYTWMNLHFTRDSVRTLDYLDDVLAHVEMFHGTERKHLPVEEIKAYIRARIRDKYESI